MKFYVKDIMSTDIITINETQPISDLVRMFADYGILGIPVVNDENFITGVVSSTDVLRNESSKNYYEQPFIRNYKEGMFKEDALFSKPISTIMSENLFTIDPDASINKMSKMMYDNKIHRILVVEYEKLVGIVSTFDLLKLLASNEELSLSQPLE